MKCWAYKREYYCASLGERLHLLDFDQLVIGDFVVGGFCFKAKTNFLLIFCMFEYSYNIIFKAPVNLIQGICKFSNNHPTCWCVFLNHFLIFTIETNWFCFCLPQFVEAISSKQSELDTFIAEGYKTALSEERRRYCFLVDRQCAVAKNSSAYHGKVRPRCFFFIHRKRQHRQPCTFTASPVMWLEDSSSCHGNPQRSPLTTVSIGHSLFVLIAKMRFILCNCLCSKSAVK